MDSSTSEQCRQLEQACGGALQLAQLTGSRGYEVSGDSGRESGMRRDQLCHGVMVKL